MVYDVFGEVWEVFDFGGGGELVVSGGFVGYEVFIEGGCIGC